MIFKHVVDVPFGIRYLTEKGWFKLTDYPKKCIINKQSPGCGFTEYCLTGPENVILCSPRKLLLKNKYEQHPDEVYLVVNEMDKDPGVDKDLNKVHKGGATKIDDNGNQIIDENSEIYRKIFDEIDSYILNRSCCPGVGLKILVTYDSYHLVMDILRKQGRFDRFITVVDEFQSILHDARFKSDTELKFMDHLRRSPTTMFVSATPMMDEYIDQLREFDGLNYFILDWGAKDPTRVIKPDLSVYYMSSINSKSSEIIQSYLSGNFESIVVMRDGQPIEIKSTEAVLYVNSVNLIINIVKNNNLQPDQINILCADTEDNKRRIQSRLGKKFNIGSIPLKGEPNKMFTLCTRTVYLGADFYSKCARSFIFSDSNSDSLAVDISEDLPQILGRQRDVDNPWKNSANFYYKTTADYRKMTQEDFDKKIAKKISKTESLLRAYNDTQSREDKQNLAENYQTVAKLMNYKDDYVAVNRVEDWNPFTNKVEMISKPLINDLVKINEIRAFKIQQYDYKDRFTVFSRVKEKFDYNDYINEQVSSFLNVYNHLTTIYDKLKYISETSISKEAIDIVLSQLPESDHVKSYYTILGPARLRELGYSITKIKKELGIVIFNPELLHQSIYSNFHVGDKLPLSIIKTKLSDIYKSINYSASPKAIDIKGYFGVREYIMYEKKSDGSGRKQIRCYELIESYEQKLREDLKYSN